MRILMIIIIMLTFFVALLSYSTVSARLPGWCKDKMVKNNWTYKDALDNCQIILVTYITVVYGKNVNTRLTYIIRLWIKCVNDAGWICCKKPYKKRVCHTVMVPYGQAD